MGGWWDTEDSSKEKSGAQKRGMKSQPREEKKGPGNDGAGLNGFLLIYIRVTLINPCGRMLAATWTLAL